MGICNTDDIQFRKDKVKNKILTIIEFPCNDKSNQPSDRWSTDL